MGVFSLAKNNLKQATLPTLITTKMFLVGKVTIYASV